MKTIPKSVLLAWLLCATCFISGGLLRLCEVELSFVAQVLAVIGILGVSAETFRWGVRQGYVIAGQPPLARLEHIVRCVAMSFILVIAAGFVAGPVLQITYEKLWRAQ